MTHSLEEIVTLVGSNNVGLGAGKQMLTLELFVRSLPFFLLLLPPPFQHSSTLVRASIHHLII